VGPTCQRGRKLKRKEKKEERRWARAGWSTGLTWAVLFRVGPVGGYPFFLFFSFLFFCRLFSLEFENKNCLDLDISNFVNF
jgi:hypothetical protein